MAETKTNVLEREYIIPLRNEWMKVSRYKKTAKSVKAVKEFIAKHMRVVDRDLDKVKLDVYLNNEMWFRGGRTPFTKIKVRARKEGDIVKVELADVPDYVKFLKAKHEKLHKKFDKLDKKAGAKPEEKKEGPEGPERTVEEKKTEVEKEKAVEDVNTKMAEQKSKTLKHTPKDKKVITHRMALQK